METGQAQITTFIPQYGRLQNAIASMVYKARELQKYFRSLLRLKIRNILQMAFLGVLAGIIYGALNTQPIDQTSAYNYCHRQYYRICNGPVDWHHRRVCITEPIQKENLSTS